MTRRVEATVPATLTSLTDDSGTSAFGSDISIG